MDLKTVGQLTALNQQFYQTFAAPFSETRRRIQPGVQRFLSRLPNGTALSLLDIGCGNGELGLKLLREGKASAYFGLDFSLGLIKDAQKLLNTAGWFEPQVRFQKANLANPDWDVCLGSERFDWITAFAVFHHLPGVEIRETVTRRIRTRLAPGGRFILSNWQFMNSPRLASRVVGWEHAGIDQQAIDPGDTLLDWRAGGSGLRYVHLFSEEELTTLAAASGFRVSETYYSDGKEGNLGLYQVWEPI